MSVDQTITGHPIPLVDLVAHARAANRQSTTTRPDIVTTVTVYTAAILTTAGFVIATVVDELLRVRGRPSRVRRTSIA